MRVPKGKWIGVGLDGTLAMVTQKPGGIGPPVPLMMQRVHRWLEEGHEVRILTARATWGDAECTCYRILV